MEAADGGYVRSLLTWPRLATVPRSSPATGKSVNMCSTFTETIRLLRDGENGGMEVEEEGDHIPIATLSPPD